MKQRIFMFLLVFVILSSFGFATLSGTNVYYILNQTSGWMLNDTNPDVNESDSITDYFGSNDGTLYGKTFNHGTITGATRQNNLTGTITGATWNTSCELPSGKTGNCLEFDGDTEQITIPELSLNETTISFKVKLEDLNEEYYFFRKAGSGNNYIRYRPSLNNIYFIDNSGNVARTGNIPDFDLQEWYEITITKGNNVVSFYLNGVNYPTVINSSNDLFNFNLFGKLNGTISDVTILDKALTSDEVLDLYNSGVANYSGYAHEINFPLDEGTGTEVYTKDGKFGGYYEFDGDGDYIDLNSLPTSINGTEPNTICFYIKSDNFDYNILHLSQSGDNRYGVSYDSSKRIRFGYYNGAVWNSFRSEAYSISDWTHYCFVTDGNYFDAYQNGVNLTSNSDTIYVTGGVADFSIGKEDGLSYFNGSIDEVRIWNRSLTQAEIQEEMNSNAVANPEGIVAYYDFNERKGTTAYDQNHLSTGARQSTSSLDEPMFSWDKAMNFDGVDDYIDFSSIPDYINGTESNTISMWIKKNSLGSMHLLHLSQGENNRYGTSIDATERLRFGYYDGSTWKSVKTLATDLSEWNNVVFLNREGSYDIYLNGLNVSSSFVSEYVTGGIDEQTLGKDQGTYEDFNGSIADVRIYDRSLTQQEIDALYYDLDSQVSLSLNETLTNGEFSLNLSNSHYSYSDSISSTNQTYHLSNEVYNITILQNGSEIYKKEHYIESGASTIDLSAITYNYVNYQDNNATAFVGYNVTIQYPNGDSIVSPTNNNGTVSFLSTSSNDLQNGTYYFTFPGLDGYETPYTISYTTSSDILPFNLTYNISRTTISVTVYNRNTGKLLNTTTVNIVLQDVGNYSTTNGTYSFDALALASGSYQIQTFASNFFTEQKTINFDAQESISVSLYMLETELNTSNTLTVEVLDIGQAKVTNAEVNLLEYDLSTLSYIGVSQCFTDSEGECKFLVELNDKTYKVTASKTIDGDLLTASSGDEGKIFRQDIIGGSPATFEELTLTLILQQTSNYFFVDLNNLNYNITENYNSTTNISNIRVDFSTTDGSDFNVCIEYFSLIGSTATSELPICVNSNAGTVTPTTPFQLNGSKTYRLDVYVLNNDTSRSLLDRFNYKSSTSLQETLRNYAILSPFMILLWIIVIAIGLYSGIIPLISILGIFLSVGEWLMFPNFMTGAGMALKVLLLLQLMYFGRKKEDFK